MVQRLLCLRVIFHIIKSYARFYIFLEFLYFLLIFFSPMICSVVSYDTSNLIGRIRGLITLLYSGVRKLCFGSTNKTDFKTSIGIDLNELEKKKLKISKLFEMLKKKLR